MWTYSQSTAYLYHNNIFITNGGYSGFGDGKNNPAMEGFVDAGPIPRGRYKFGFPECLATLDGTKACPDCGGMHLHTHGPYVLRLIPDEPTQTFIESLGRGPNSFLCHGDSIEHPGKASRGCLIQTSEIRNMIARSGDSDFEVLA